MELGVEFFWEWKLSLEKSSLTLLYFVVHTGHTGDLFCFYLTM